MQKKIAKVSPSAFGHLMLEFEDGTKQMVHRGDHEAHQPKAGEMWLPEWSLRRLGRQTPSLHVPDANQSVVMWSLAGA